MARSQPRRRTGAVQSFELLLTLPLLFGVVLATIQFGLLNAANHKLKAACYQVARIASRPANNPLDREALIRTTIQNTLGSEKLASACRYRCEPGEFTGDLVTVRLQLPMKAAAPDLLCFLGLGLGSRQLTAETVVHRE